MSAPFKLSSITLLAILMLSLCLIGFYPASAQTDQTTSKLQAANSVVEHAFIVVLDAESAGANVTDLLAQLNYAEGVLAQAEISYRIGDFNKAAVQADNVLPIAQQVTTAAQVALGFGQISFWSRSIVSTVVGGFVFVLVLFLVWGWFKRSYFKSLSDAKPEVVS